MHQCQRSLTSKGQKRDVHYSWRQAQRVIIIDTGSSSDMLEDLGSEADSLRFDVCFLLYIFEASRVDIQPAKSADENEKGG